MSDSIRIAHLTDLHISPDDNDYRGIPVRHHFQRVLEKLVRHRPDLLIFSGDLAANQGEVEAYAWLKEQLDFFDCPYILMPGNHDVLENVRQVFTLHDDAIHEGEYYFSSTYQGYPMIFLDSSRHVISPAQLTWLKALIPSLSQPALLFIHHPPRLCDCAFMDGSYALRNWKQLWSLLVEYSAQIPYIFCGHYHLEKTIVTQASPTLFITPSTLMQIRSDTTQFVVNHAHPGWRVIVWNGKELFTQVEYAWC